MLIFRIFVSLLFVVQSIGLQCVQCRVIEKNKFMATLPSSACYKAKIPPTHCPKSNHTHCIVYHFRAVESRKKVILWRKCGTIKEAQQKCQIHDLGRMYLEHTELRDSNQPQMNLDNIALTRTTYTIPIPKTTRKSPSAASVGGDGILDRRGHEEVTALSLPNSDIRPSRTTTTTQSSSEQASVASPPNLVEVCVHGCDVDQCLPNTAMSYLAPPRLSILSYLSVFFLCLLAN